MSREETLSRPLKVCNAELSAMTDEQLMEELKACLALTAQCVARAAATVKLLEDRGYDLASLKIGMIAYYRLIASGQLLPDVMVRFVGNRNLIRIISSLPVQDQEELAGGKPVRLIVYAPDGSLTHRMADPLDMVPAQIAQVFTHGKIRSDSEQALILDQKRVERKRRPPKIGELRMDYQKMGAWIGRKFIGLQELQEAAKTLRKA